MTRRIFCKVLLVVVAIFGLLVLSGVLLAQGRSEDAFDRVKEVQERNTGWLMAMDGVEGTAVGLDQATRPVVTVFTENEGVPGIPEKLEGIPVMVVVTGKIYALAPPANRPPKPPRGLTATAVSDTEINLDWRDNREPDLSHYNVYRSTTSGSYGESIASVDEPDSSYSDSGLTAGTTYYYVVTAVDADNESDPSDEASVTPGESEPPPEEPDPTSRWPRPVPIGVSTGHPNISAGTIGCRVTDGENVYALSNNHVYADENNGLRNVDPVLQPGPSDGGGTVEDRDDVIGTLFDFKPIVFTTSASNTIDAAIALSSTSLLDNATPSDGYGRPKSKTVSAGFGQVVKKYGRTTGQTKGQIWALNVTVNVNYGDSGTARFVNQFGIVPIKGQFSAGGDSGSLIITQKGNPVGLLFAGGEVWTFANPIDDVLDAFGVTIDGK